MLNFGNREFRNLQEQVKKNMDDINFILEEEGVLNEFGIKVVGQEDDVSDIPSVADYKEDNENWAYGDAYAIGDEAPYTLYVLTRANGTHPSDYWFNIGQFPVRGPQGAQGVKGDTGTTPSISTAATVETLSAGQSATVSATRSGPDASPSITFAFGIPQGAQGIQGPQGIQGIQGIQGPKGDTGYLYTILGQVSDDDDLPNPASVLRTAAYLVGSSEPYDVYIIIGTNNLEWINIGPIATVVPSVYIASDQYASSGTLNSSTLNSILASTDMHYLRDGSMYFQRSDTIQGSGYYTCVSIDNVSGDGKINYLVLNLATGAWTVTNKVLDIPTYTIADAGKSLTVNSTGTAISWESVTSDVLSALSIVNGKLCITYEE